MRLLLKYANLETKSCFGGEATINPGSLVRAGEVLGLIGAAGDGAARALIPPIEKVTNFVPLKRYGNEPRLQAFFEYLQCPAV